jgi:hypothetical protein
VEICGLDVWAAEEKLAMCYFLGRQGHMMETNDGSTKTYQ